MAKIILEEQTEPSTPPSNKVAIYPKAGGDVYKKADDGTEGKLVIQSTIYTQAEVDTISGSLQTNIDAKDNYSSWSFAVDGVTKDAITSGDVLDFVGGDNITITRTADDQVTISGSAGGGGTSGTSGSSGTSGAAGTSGTSGADGTSGSSGTSGADGTSGSSGSSGTSGVGTSGSSGTSGEAGTSGSSGTSGGISNVVEDTSPQLGGDLDLNNHNISYESILTVSGTYEGEIITSTVDDASTIFGNVLYQAADFHFERADADSTTTSPVFVMALENGSGSKKVMFKGQICDTSWNWSAGMLYLSTDVGEMVQTVVSGSGDQIQILGFALSADTIYFNPQYVIAEV